MTLYILITLRSDTLMMNNNIESYCKGKVDARSRSRIDLFDVILLRNGWDIYVHDLSDDCKWMEIYSCIGVKETWYSYPKRYPISTSEYLDLSMYLLVENGKELHIWI